MCGICGYLCLDQPEPTTDLIARMTRSMPHRGPDDEGFTVFRPDSDEALDFAPPDAAADGVVLRNPAAGRPVDHRLAFGHRRFSIIDLSPAAHQPFWSSCGRVCVAFHGEVYNYVEVREELEKLGRTFTTTSDTEVIAESYLQWGTDCFRWFDGIYAISLYDRERKQALLARDRIGKAPLYMAKVGSKLFWCSEIQGLFAAVGKQPFPVRDQAVWAYLHHSWRDVFDRTFYEGITTFPKASFAWLEPDGSYTPESYWSLPTERYRESELGVDEAAKELRELLADAVRLRMRADVPVAFGLSGGMDSSALVALAAYSGSRLSSTTVEYPDHPQNEEPFARAVAERWPEMVDYNVVRVAETGFLDVADDYLPLMAEPVHSPVLLFNKDIYHDLAKQGIRVSINGAGGDEIFAGYPDEAAVPFFRHLLSHGKLGRFAHEFFDNTNYRRGLKPTLKRMLNLLPDRRTSFNDIGARVSAAIDPFREPAGLERLAGPSLEINQRLLDNMTDWRMNYWLRSGNQNHMTVPLEVRCPLLDHRVVEFAFKLPLTYIIRDGWHKWLLRKATEDILPESVVWRRVKMGMNAPLDQFLPVWREPLFAELAGLDCPYVDFDKFRQHYDEISRHDRHYTFRLVCFALWWKRCILDRPLTEVSKAA